MNSSHRHVSKSTLVACFLAVAFTAHSVSAQTELITNGGFEQVLVPTDSYALLSAPTLPAEFTPVPGPNQGGTIANSIGWMTTAYDPVHDSYPIEVWNGGFLVPSQSSGPYSGSQYAEMNSITASTLFQPIANQAPGSQLYLSFAHQSRDVVSSSMHVTLYDLGANGVFESQFATPTSALTLGGDDGILIDQLIGPATYDSANGFANWSFNQFQTLSLTNNNMLLAFQSVTAGAAGNFIDNVSLNTVPAAPVPEPSGAVIIMAATGIAILSRRRRA
jgi:hypothetical protein